MTRLKTPQVVNCKVGDVVLADFTRIVVPESRRIRIIRVKQIKVRYGTYQYELLRVPGERPHRAAPLIIGINIQTGQIEGFDQSLVSRVLESASGYQPAPRNIFRNDPRHQVFTPVGRTWKGSLLGMISHILGNQLDTLDRPLDEVRVYKLWDKNHPGMLRDNWGYVTVRPELLKRWVKQNAHRLMKTVSALDYEGTRKIRRDDKIMEDDLDRFDEMDRNLGYEVPMCGN